MLGKLFLTFLPLVFAYLFFRALSLWNHANSFGEWLRASDELCLMGVLFALSCVAATLVWMP